MDNPITRNRNVRLDIYVQAWILGVYILQAAHLFSVAFLSNYENNYYLKKKKAKINENCQKITQNTNHLP